MSQPEAKLSREIMKTLRLKGYFVFKVHGSEYMMAGLPDIIVCAEGKFVGLETKMPSQRYNTSVQQRLVPVSYTHLDVYKRQKHDYSWVCVDGLTKFSNMSLKYVMKLQEDRSLDRIPGLVQQRDYGKSGELMKDLLTRFHNMPVSYTHLDVYKRQILDLSSSKTILWETLMITTMTEPGR